MKLCSLLKETNFLLEAVSNFSWCKYFHLMPSLMILCNKHFLFVYLFKAKPLKENVHGRCEKKFKSSVSINFNPDYIFRESKNQ